MGFDAPMGKNKASPWPISFSAPDWSKITLESVWDDVAKASRLGTFALMSPVTTSTEGRWVANTKWMPAARASWVMRWIEASTYRGATIMRTEGSSTPTMREGEGTNLRLIHGGGSTLLT